MTKEKGKTIEFYLKRGKEVMLGMVAREEVDEQHIMDLKVGFMVLIGKIKVEQEEPTDKEIRFIFDSKPTLRKIVEQVWKEKIEEDFDLKYILKIK